MLYKKKILNYPTHFLPHPKITPVPKMILRLKMSENNTFIKYVCTHTVGKSIERIFSGDQQCLATSFASNTED